MNSAQATPQVARLRAEGRLFQPAPVPDPPERVAGLAAEVTYLRSRDFKITAGTGDWAGWWKVDGTFRSADWVRDKVASLKARSIRNAPEPVKLTGEAPIAVVPTLPRPAPAAAAAEPPPGGRAPGPERTWRNVDYRGLGAAGVLDVLEALRPHFQTVTALGRAVGEPKNLGLMLAGRRSVSAAVVEALFGPSGSELLPQWLELIAGAGGDQQESGGPVTVPEPVQDLASQVPSEPASPAGQAPAAETAEAAGPPAAGLETETAAGDGAAVDLQQIPAGPDVAPIADVTEEPQGDAGKAVDDAQAPRTGGSASAEACPTMSPVPGGDITLSETAGPGTGEGEAAENSTFANSPAAEEAGEGPEPPASDLSQHPMAQPAVVTPSRLPWILPAIESAPGQPLPEGRQDFLLVADAGGHDAPGLPSWAGIPDDQLLTILRGKAAGIAAELEANDAQRRALHAQIQSLYADALELEQRRDALWRAIEIFEGEPAGQAGQQETVA